MHYRNEMNAAPIAGLAAVGGAAIAIAALLFGRQPTLWERMFASKTWPSKTPSWIAAIVAEAARASRVPPALVSAIAHVESRFRADAVSHAGAIGVMQLMPKTARALGVDPYDVRENVHGGARYIALQLRRFGRLELALAAYNAGPPAVERYGGVPPYDETQRYVTRVLEEIHRRL